MRILLVSHSFNSLTQRVYVELALLGHDVSVELDIHPGVLNEALNLFSPDVVVAPFLKRAIPESVWSKTPCLVVHPGIVGDRGPSALDWAILNGETEWGVTVFRANGSMDEGDVYAWRHFPMRCASKGSLYRNEVCEAAVGAVHEALERLFDPEFHPWPWSSAPVARRGEARPLVRQQERMFDWEHSDTRTILRRIRSGDGVPGAEAQLFSVRCRLFDVHEEPLLRGAPGEPLAQRGGAICVGTRNGAVWIGHVKRLDVPHTSPDAVLKLPAAIAFARECAHLPERPAPLFRQEGAFQEIAYEESGGVGYLSFEFYNGAMGEAQCERLLAALEQVRERSIKVVALLGGRDFWSNGIHLGLIENDPSPAEASLRNIRAINRVARAILSDTERLYVSALRGNAGSGGCFLALAADRVFARLGVTLNPHYKNMGNLYGSEFWTYVLPRKVGESRVPLVMAARLPMGTVEACALGLLDGAWGETPESFVKGLKTQLEALASSPSCVEWISRKRAAREASEREKSLDRYEEEELARMKENFFGFDPSYHVARHNFIRKVPHSRTPLHLAKHRRQAR